ncbi:hypothetical protein FHQ26_10550 [Testudinibacter sp. TR-2022]|uniref:hypothetical protein n=1 Tax=Testudinibacter sp. TR-2022 TaxID=2585029 RepID=UPI00111821F2|nr:hypothetical protein [Testudinibacter sp. TR-2022]TNH05467.1 hypothetical protein FHQ22_01210 [Pasteurellaceae bacterium Phil31]TNH07158.1 hypothetical protein FHQ26_10550 [Testudinibacter sp. TR-2022]TNH11144.1 hypothetical protein FHQ25_03430 [Testudinibacter sp. TR-2022]TNH13365.1 hypothetical protein FIA56_07990 [Testudinibacter sp. TR-2022]TNH16318.1 hypothetical protein FHQ23_08695 [Testudinibacter sp. TR-2022]
MKTYYTLLFNRTFKLSLLLLLIQQFIIASSTYWIAISAERIATQQPYFLYLSLFIVSLIIVYIPSVISISLLEKAKIIALNSYHTQFRTLFYGLSNINADKNQKKIMMPYLSSESFLVIDESYRFIYDWIAVILNVLFNIITLAFLLEANIIYAYFIGLLLVLGFILKFNTNVAEKSRQAQQDRTELQHHLSQIWDNCTLGNQYNDHLYQQDLLKKQQSLLFSAVKSKQFNNIVSSVGMLIMMLPVIMLILFLFYQYRTSPAMLAVLIATLPRQVIMLQYCYSIISYITQWSALKAKLNGLLQALIPPPTNSDIYQRILWDKFNVSTSANLNIEMINLEYLKNNLPKQGRITIQAPNGAGKSSYLIWLKTQLAEQAYYLPTYHHLQFSQTNTTHCSTGEVLKYNLNELQQHLDQKIKVIMLDEWNANLDAASTNEVDQLIEKLSQLFLIVEVRHHI